MSARTGDPVVLGRVDDLERIARKAHAEDRIDVDAHDLAVRYCAVVRDVLPRISGWGSAQACLLQSTDQAIALLARFMRVPTRRAAGTAEAGPLTLPHPTVAGILTSGLEVLVGYAESLDAAVTDADVARLLELQRAVDLAFGPGFRPSTGIGDPAREPDPDPKPEPDPPPRGPSLTDFLCGLLRAISIEMAAVLITFAVILILAVWRPR